MTKVASDPSPAALKAKQMKHAPEKGYLKDETDFWDNLSEEANN